MVYNKPLAKKVADKLIQLKCIAPP